MQKDIALGTFKDGLPSYMSISVKHDKGYYLINAMQVELERDENCTIRKFEVFNCNMQHYKYLVSRKSEKIYNKIVQAISSVSDADMISCFLEGKFKLKMVELLENI
jgi:hypothetical protein